jgi:F420-dependent oxidoreductase-like protein
MDITIMIEGQNGLNWPSWQRLARLVEDAGFGGLFRSDHYTNARPPDRDSLELWVSLTWLASHTRRLEFGPLVTPVSFRHPTFTARMACAVDDLSGGRLTLGMGAGWQEREHNNYGWELLDVARRMKRLEEGLEVVTRLLRAPGPVSFEGEFYRLHDAVLLPRPQRVGGPPILIGGNGPRRTLPLVARYATEWNAVFVTPERFSELNARLDDLLRANGRRPAEVRRSLMTGTLFGRDEAEFRRLAGDRDLNQLRASGVICGAPSEFREYLSRLAAAGVQRIMLQWLDLDDLDRLEALGQAVLS